MKVTVDTDVCIGFGNCEQTCPRVFKVYSGISTVQVHQVPKTDEACVQEAEKECPSGAIKVEE